jgi:uncharacterized protein
VKHPLLVNVVELLRRPGTERSLEATETVEEIGVVDSRYAPHALVDIVLHLESTSDALVVTGAVNVPWHDTCRRCLETATGVTRSEVHEVYQAVVTDPDAYQLPADVLDLRPMVRELVVLDAPLAPLCSQTCAGLCPVCGTNRNVQRCECTAEVSDMRWAALDELRHQLD